MSDPFRAVSPGQPLRRSIRADAWNAAMAAAVAHQRARLGGGAGTPTHTVDPALTVLIRNTTANDLPAGSILAIDDIVGDPAEDSGGIQSRPMFTGVTSMSEDDPVVILAEPIPAGEYGRAIISGVAVVDVEVRADSHRYAVPRWNVAGWMRTANQGPARILWLGDAADPPADPDIRKAVVSLGQADTGCIFVRVTEGGGGDIYSWQERILSVTGGDEIDGPRSGVLNAVLIPFWAISSDPGSTIPVGTQAIIWPGGSGFYWMIPFIASNDVIPGYVVPGSQDFGPGTKTVQHLSASGNVYASQSIFVGPSGDDRIMLKNESSFNQIASLGFFNTANFLKVYYSYANYGGGVKAAQNWVIPEEYQNTIGYTWVSSGDPYGSTMKLLSPQSNVNTPPSVIFSIGCLGSVPFEIYSNGDVKINGTSYSPPSPPPSPDQGTW